MVRNKDLQKDVQDTIKSEPLLNAAETGVNTKIGKNLKKFIYLTSLAGMGLFFNACMPAYVGTEPTYMETERPPRPSDHHIWIDGDWVWNRQTNAYMRNAGYWEQPRQGRTYVSGHWQSTPKGKYWAKGHWQKQGRQGDNHRR
jgi:hypothetical protein